jgi:hypothetical protein
VAFVQGRRQGAPVSALAAIGAISVKVDTGLMKENTINKPL